LIVRKVKEQPVFSNLRSPSIVYGTVTTTLSGHLAAGSDVPPAGETVSITIDGMAQTALLDASGDFRVAFPTSKLGVAGSPYTVSYAYAGDSSFNAAGDSSTTLSVTPAALTITANNASKTFGRTLTFAGTEFTASGLVNGDSVSSVTLTS